MQDYVKYTIKLRPCKELGDKIHVDFKMSNTSDKDLMILKWNTPLEGVKSDMFKILKGKYRVPYDGKLIKRASPTEKDYVKLKSGESVSASVEITDHYGIHNDGEYHIALKSVGLNYIVMQKGGKKKQKYSGDESNPFFLNTEKVAFSLEKGKNKPRLTLGKISRKASTGKASISRFDMSAGKTMKMRKSTELEKWDGAPSVKAPVIVGGTSSQRTKVTNAHNKAFTKSQECVDQLNGTSGPNNTLYRTWFGNYARSRYDTVNGNYLKIHVAMTNDTITYNLSGKDCGPNDYAYTYKGSREIWLCGAFWNAPTRGVDTQFGTIIHELSHAIDRTDDLAYGQARAKNLALMDPGSAIKNADSYEYFSENV